MLSFWFDAKTDACIKRSPIGADPGFQSVAIANLHPESNIFLAGAKGSPKPKLQPGKTTPVESEFERS